MAAATTPSALTSPRLRSKVGDDVKGGARIATLAGSGSAGSTLYFEVRIGQETADPAEWFGI